MDNHDNVFKSNNPVVGSRNLLAHNGEGTVLQEFYRGAHVLVTGATGFMGKVLVEKLLRSCPGIARISLLMRAKKGRSVEDRIDDLLAFPCFSQLISENPKLKTKLVAITGDIGTPHLGISDADQRLLSDVSVVFHLAATVRFDEHLKIAINQNVRGTIDVLELCRSFNKLKSVMHVSTAYSNCPRETIGECLYDPPISYRDALKLEDLISDEEMQIITPRFIGKWPNNYSFSKAIAEDAVKTYGQDLPVGVFRPSIVASCMNEPVPGWTDSFFGPMGLCLGAGSGVIRTLHVDCNNVCNVVPCDMAINCLIAAAWDVAEKRSSSTIPVYNFTVHPDNTCTWADGNKSMFEEVAEKPVLNAMWYICVVYTPIKQLSTIYRALLHFLPALLYDFFLMVTRKKTQMVRLYSKIHKLDDAYVYFNSRLWHFETENVYDLWRRLSPRDKSLFDFDLRSIDWRMYHKNVWSGIRIFLAKQSSDSIPAARIRMRRLYWLHRSTQAVLVFLCFYICWTALFSVVH